KRSGFTRVAPTLDDKESIDNAYSNARSKKNRGLPPDSKAPMSENLINAQHSWDRKVVESIAHGLKHKPGALLPILRWIQDELGWVPRDSVPVVAEILNLTRAEVHGVLSFYHDFRHEPPGRNVVKVCRAESCQAMGGVKLAEHVKHRLGCDFGST